METNLSSMPRWKKQLIRAFIKITKRKELTSSLGLSSLNYQREEYVFAIQAPQRSHNSPPDHRKRFNVNTAEYLPRIKAFSCHTTQDSVSFKPTETPASTALLFLCTLNQLVPLISNSRKFWQNTNTANWYYPLSPGMLHERILIFVKFI